MSKITEAAKGLKAAACELHNNEYIKGYNHSCVTSAAAILVGLVLADVVAIVGTYIIDKQ
jgi:hypothetical protein